MKLRQLLLQERRYFWVAFALCLALSVAMMAQSFIRYGGYEGYNPWNSLQYELIVYFLFLPVLVPFFQLGVFFKPGAHSRYYLILTGIAIGFLIGFYVLTSVLFRLLGYFQEDGWLSVTYASYYFGRDALFHLLFLSGTAFYIKTRNGQPKRVSGTHGRKKIEVNSETIHWIEADDHYLRIHTPHYELLKRSTLDQMAQELDPDFIRIHRKYLVNRKMIVGTEKVQRDKFVVLDSGERIKVGRSYASSVTG